MTTKKEEAPRARTFDKARECHTYSLAIPKVLWKQANKEAAARGVSFRTFALGLLEREVGAPEKVAGTRINDLIDAIAEARDKVADLRSLAIDVRNRLY